MHRVTKGKFSLLYCTLLLLKWIIVGLDVVGQTRNQIWINVEIVFFVKDISDNVSGEPLSECDNTSGIVTFFLSWSNRVVKRALLAIDRFLTGRLSQVWHYVKHQFFIWNLSLLSEYGIAVVPLIIANLLICQLFLVCAELYYYLRSKFLFWVLHEASRYFLVVQ